MDEKFYIYNKFTSNFELVMGEKVTIEHLPNFDFFVHLSNVRLNNKESWNVTESISGSTVTVNCSSKEEAIKEAKTRLEKINKEEFISLVKDRILKYGISPRYISKVLP
jgi:hypothetical protein